MLRLRAVPALLLVCSAPLAAQSADPLFLEARGESRVWLEGTTSVGGFTCTATQARAVLEVDPRVRRGTLPVGASGIISARVTIPVRGLRCGNRRMEQDLYEAMKADSFPTITFVLDGARIAGTESTSAVVAGRLGFAGAQRSVEAKVHLHRGELNSATLSSRLPVRMTDYGVKPPTAMLGLIRVSDHVTVGIDARLTLPTPDALENARSVVIVLRSRERAAAAGTGVTASSR